MMNNFRRLASTSNDNRKKTEAIFAGSRLLRASREKLAKLTYLTQYLWARSETRRVSAEVADLFRRKFCKTAGSIIIYSVVFNTLILVFKYSDPGRARDLYRLGWLALGLSMYFKMRFYQWWMRRKK